MKGYVDLRINPVGAAGRHLFEPHFQASQIGIVFRSAFGRLPLLHDDFEERLVGSQRHRTAEQRLFGAMASFGNEGAVPQTRGFPEPRRAYAYNGCQPPLWLAQSVRFSGALTNTCQVRAAREILVTRTPRFQFPRFVTIQHRTLVTTRPWRRTLVTTRLWAEHLSRHASLFSAHVLP